MVDLMSNLAKENFYTKNITNTRIFKKTCIFGLIRINMLIL